jgi:microcystin-dependent protein
MTPFVGQIIAVGFNFAPAGWLPCNGQLVPISEYETLFTLLGTTYGGDGQTTFGIPDLRGRTPLAQGTGSGLSPYSLGQTGGTESVTLTSATIGAHTHPLLVSEHTGSTGTPANTLVLGQGGASEVNVYGAPTTTPTALNSAAVGPSAAGNLPHENRQPFLAINYIIAPDGIFPSPS